MMNAAAVPREIMPNRSSRPPEKPGPREEPDTIIWNRRMPYMAQFNNTPDRRADTGVGAWEWASGSQVCMGARPTLVP